MRNMEIFSPSRHTRIRTLPPHGCNLASIRAWTRGFPIREGPRLARPCPIAAQNIWIDQTWRPTHKYVPAVHAQPPSHPGASGGTAHPVPGRTDSLVTSLGDEMPYRNQQSLIDE